jgi:hypothetical protein
MHALIAGLGLTASSSTLTSLGDDWWEYLLLFLAVMASWAGVPAIGPPLSERQRWGQARAP